jgi:RND superfamily putative drug exporter
VFAAWGHLVYRRRRLVLLLSLVLLAVSAIPLAQGGRLVGQVLLRASESGRAERLIRDEIAPATTPQPSGTSLLVVFSARDDRRVADARFRDAMLTALQPLRDDARVQSVRTPYDVPPAQATSLTSRDGTRALASVDLKDELRVAEEYYPELRALVRSDTLDIAFTGTMPINRDFDRTLDADLQRAEYVSLPLALALLLFVFGAVLAALLPLGVGLLAIVGGLGGVYVISRVTDVSQYALNIVTLVGLGVAIDYSLFITSRFREELRHGAAVEDALATALSTAGRAITFSGLTVAIGLAGMLFYQGTFLASLGLAGALVVAIAVLYALTFLPAVLALLGHRVDALRLPLGGRMRRGLWHAIAMGVMRHPLLVLVPTVAFVLLAGAPFLHLRLANTDVAALPPTAESRRGFDLLVGEFPGQNQSTVTVVAYFPDGRVLSPQHVDDLYDTSRRLAAIPGVLRVFGPLDIDPSFDRGRYQALYAQPRESLPAEVQQLLRFNVGEHIAVLAASTSKAASSDDAREIVRAIRALPEPQGGELLVTGRTAFELDTIAFVAERTPLALAFIVLTTYVVLFLLLGSVLLPLKALLANLLSVSASFGALVWIFEDGHLATQLNFTPQSLDPTVPVILFCIVFGLSMDYEVFLLTRMQEEWRRTGDNEHAVAEGLERSGRLVTGAAAIMLGVFSAFALADVVIIKSIGLGLAIAVLIDATIVRALIVPAAMRLLGALNWWAPAPLARLYRRAGMAEVRPAAADPAG